MKYKINEIFYSIQGEGRMTGMAVIFVRFSGCNFNCSFCDTDHESFKEMTAKEIKRDVYEYRSNIVVFTGGEPALQLDEELISELKPLHLCIETNGTINIDHLSLDWITISPKGVQKQLVAGEVKNLVGPHTQKKDIKELPGAFTSLQPISKDPGAIKNCINLIKRNPRWRLSTQIHRYLGIR
jgi:organic radical activating enzyme